jgi:hypothetical protein
LTGAEITVLALAEPFIASGAAAAFWSFSAEGKGLGPRGYERIEIMNAWWVPPSTRKFKHVVFDFLNRYARVILNKVKELSCYESKIILRTTKVPHLLKGKFRDDIGFLIEIYFLKRCAGIIPAYRLTDNAAQDGKYNFYSPPRLHRPLIPVLPH